MKYIKLALFLLIAVSGFSQAVKLDSTVIYESRNIYNNAGYYIGKDSFHVKSVRWAYGSDTFYQRIDTLIQRFPQRFITMDSIVGGGDYIRKDQNDTVITHMTVWKSGSNETKISNSYIYKTDGTYSFHLGADKIGMARSGSDYESEIYNDYIGIYNGGGRSDAISIYSNHVTINRDGYSATGSNEVPVLGEVKALITDSLDTRLASYTDNTALDEKIEDKIGDKLLISGGSKSYNDATGETTLTITASGLTAEQVLDTVANTIRLGEGLKKTKDDSGDSLFIELKLKDALERIVYSTGCHKAVFMATNTTGGTTHWGFQVNGTGTVTAPVKSTTNRFNYANRWEVLQTTPSTSAVAGFRSSNGISGFGNTSGMGGFYFNGVAGAATGLSNTNARFFFGQSYSFGSPTDVNPSTLLNQFGIGYDSSDGNLQFMHNDGSGTATKVDLGSNFAVTTSDRTNFYRLIMYAESNTSTVYFKVIDMVDGDTYTGSVNTDLPSNTTMFAPSGYTSVGGTSAVTGFALMQLEVFSDF